MQTQRLRTWLVGMTAVTAMSACSDRELAGPESMTWLALAGSSVPSDTWQTKSARPTSSAGGFAVQIGPQIYSAGGAHAHLGEPSTLQVYDPVTDTWAHKSPPAATHAWTAAEFGGRIYIFGGWDGSAVHTTTQIYDPLTDSWSAGTPITSAHNLGAAAAINGRIYVAAGGNSSGYQSITHVLDPASGLWTEAAAIPQPRAFVGGAALNGILYVVGGDDGTQRLATLEAYDPATNTWASKAPMPTARAGATAIAFDGKLYVVGGSTQAAYTNPDYSASLTGVVEVYDPGTNSWSTGVAMPTARQAPQVAVAGGVLYAIAGYGANGSLAVNEAFGLIVAPPPPNDPATAQACLKDGWRAFGFRNQGQCVRFVQTGKDSRAGS